LSEKTDKNGKHYAADCSKSEHHKPLPKVFFCFSVICFVGQVRVDPTGDDQLPPHLLDTVQLQSKPVKLGLIDHNGQGSMFYSDICHGPQAIGEFKAGKVEFQADKTGIVYVLFGKSDFPADDLLVNSVAVAVSLFPSFNL